MFKPKLWLASDRKHYAFHGFFLDWLGGPVPWTMLSELLPDSIHTLGSSVATLSNWLMATVVTANFEGYVWMLLHRNLRGGRLLWSCLLVCFSLSSYCLKQEDSVLVESKNGSNKEKM